MRCPTAKHHVVGEYKLDPYRDSIGELIRKYNLSSIRILEGIHNIEGGTVQYSEGIAEYRLSTGVKPIPENSHSSTYGWGSVTLRSMGKEGSCIHSA